MSKRQIPYKEAYKQAMKLAGEHGYFRYHGRFALDKRKHSECRLLISIDGFITGVCKDVDNGLFWVYNPKKDVILRKLDENERY